MKAEIISIGDELLIGQVVNTNASWMAVELTQAGISVVHVSTISDTEDAILGALRDSSRRANVVLITGGLGPTNDDITKEVLTKYFGGELKRHQASLERIEKLFKARHIPLSAVNQKQAEIPSSCTPIPNYNGTAPGMWFEKDDVVYVSMPGVPFEMKSMVSNQLLPKILERFEVGSIVNKTILTHGVGESYLAELIKDWEAGLPTHMKLAYLPQPGIVRLRISASGKEKHRLEDDVEHQIKLLQELIPKLIFGYGTTTMEAVVGKLLLDRGQTLCTAESCTGGYISHLLTSIPGSSNYFMGAVVSYADAIKIDILGVSASSINENGAVSQEVVEAMAIGARKRMHSDYAVATSGIAGPDGGTAEKPVGTIWIAVAAPSGVSSKLLKLGEHRGRNIRRSSLAVLNMLRLQLMA